MDINEGRKLLKAATPGDWRIRNHPQTGEASHVEADRIDPSHAYDIEVLGEDDTLYPTREADMKLIVWLKNNAKALLGKDFDVITATVEVGVGGYHTCNVDFETESLEKLVEQIQKLTTDWAANLMEADEDDGDLRQFTRQNANGYPTLAGGEPALGDDYDITLLNLNVNGEKADYHSDDFQFVLEKADLT